MITRSEEKTTSDVVLGVLIAFLIVVVILTVAIKW